MGYEVNFTEEEKKYFETGGQSAIGPEPEQEKEQPSEQSGQDVQRNESAAEVETSSDERDEPDSREYKQAESGSDESSSEDGADRQTSDEESPERNFRKAYDSERHRRLELKKQLEQTAKKNQEYETMVKQLTEKLTQAPTLEQPRQEIPDPNEDPLAYAQYKIDSLSKSVEEQQQYLAQQRQQQQYSQHYNQFVSTYANSAKEFSREAPDFNNAYKHLMDSRMQEYQAAGYSDSEAVNIIQQEEMQIVAKAYNDGVNPAERLYQLAKIKGYAKAEPKRDSKLDNVGRGIKSSKSLGTGTSGHTKDTVSIDDIDSMSFNEFDDFWNNKLMKELKK